MGSVVQLERIRAAVRILLAGIDKPAGALDEGYLRQVDTAVTTLIDHGDTLPARHQAALGQLLDPCADPEHRRQALTTLASWLHLGQTATVGDAQASIDTLQSTPYTQGTLFDAPTDEPY